VSSRSPVITGLGIVSAAGLSVNEVWGSIETNTSGLRPLKLFVSPRYGQVLAGEVRPDLTKLGAPLHGSRSDRLGWLAARQAIQSAKLDSTALGERAGLVLGTSVGGSFDSERFLTALLKRGRIRARPTRFHECSSAVDLIADEFGLLGPSMAIATACSSSALAIAAAAEFIQSGEADVMLAGGADSLSHMTWAGFHSLLLVDSAGCRPFDANRAGMSLGEGAAILVLEAEETARLRGAMILARLTGWGASCDAHHTTAPHPEGAGAAAAMRSALRRAGLEPSKIDYVNAHGTGTRDNDLAETLALKSVFASHVPPLSSTKRFFGHALGASGAIEAMVCVEALRRQLLPPSLGFTTGDPALGLIPITKLQPAMLTHVMSNSFGFGGNNAVLIFSAPESPVVPRAVRREPVLVTGIGVIGPGSLGTREIEPPLPPGRVKVRACAPSSEAAQFTPNQRRRLSRLVQMALLAARRSLSPDATERLAVAIGTGLGCLADAGAFLENSISKDEAEPMPARFPASVHNAVAAQIAIDFQATGLNSAPTAGEISFESALWQAITQLAADEADCALAGAVDELNKYPLFVGQRWGMWADQTIPGEGAVVAALRMREIASLSSLGGEGWGEEVARSQAEEPSNGLSPHPQVVTVRLGRYHRPFDHEREAAWIAACVDLSSVQIVLSGAGGWPMLDPYYETTVAALNVKAGRNLEHRTYKQMCGEFHSASAYGFSVALEIARRERRGVLLYTLALRGGKALCCIQPQEP